MRLAQLDQRVPGEGEGERGGVGLGYCGDTFGRAAAALRDVRTVGAAATAAGDGYRLARARGRWLNFILHREHLNLLLAAPSSRPL